MRDSYDSYNELSLNEIGEVAAFALVAIEALRSGHVGPFEKSLIEDAVKLVSVLEVGVEASKGNTLSPSQLGPFYVVRPVLQVSTEHDMLQKSAEVSKLLGKVDTDKATGNLSEDELVLLGDFFTEVADKYQGIATTTINAEMRLAPEQLIGAQ